MATYKQIFGKQVKFLSSDPTNESEGQIWYNSTTGTFRSTVTTEAWSSSAPLGTGRYQSGSFGTQTAGVVLVGTISPATPSSNVEEYNGVGWSSATAYPAAGTSVSGAGTQTAGIAAGGNTPSMTTNAFSYDGSSWTAANALPYAANNMASCGLAKTSVIYAIGQDGSSGNAGTNKSVTFDGTNFGAGPTLNTTRMYNTTSGSGTGTAGLVFGGFIDPSPNAMTNTESFNGSSWSNEPALNTASSFISGFGTQTNTVTQVNTPNYQGSEKFDGTSWTALPDIGVASPGGLYGTSAGSTGDAGWIGSMSPTLDQTAEWTSSTNVITAGAWASATAMGTARRNPAQGVGPPTAAMVTGGINGASAVAQTEQYNGSSWTEVADLNTARQSMGSGNAGSQTAAIVFGGTTSEPMPGGMTDATEEFNGTSWTTTPNAMIAGRYQLGGCGTTAAALAFGGDPGTVDSSEEWDGTSWTEGSNLNTARQQVQGCGTQTAGLGVGGYNPPSGWLDSTEEYNGASWTVGGANLVSVGSMGMAGIQTAALSFGGSPGNPAVTTGYDGAAWSTSPSLGTGVDFNGGAGSSTAALSFGGNSPSPPTDNGITTVEEFTGQTSAANYETITTS